MKRCCCWFIWSLGAGLALAQAPAQSDYYQVDFLRAPTGEVLEVGGLDFFSDGRLAVSTRRGQVWIITNPLAEDPAQAHFELFAEGLFEGLGLAIVDDELFVLQRTELSRLSDLDGDGTADEIECLSDDWGYSGNYHEFAFGLPVDDEGNFYLSLNLGFFNPKWWHGKSVVRDRGWLLRVTPEGEISPYSFGMRSPCGLGFDLLGNLFYTDNQGDWMAACPIFHAQHGRFYGHPAGLNWTLAYKQSQTTASDTVPPERFRESAACWIPYEWSRSTGSLVPDGTGGKFGPFGGQMMVSELTNGALLRASMERVRGGWQGAVFPLLSGVGSAVRVRFAPDGSLFLGLTNRGGGGVAPGDGLCRVRWTGKTPLEIETVRLRKDGMRVKFTLPIDPEHVPSPEEIGLVDYDYDYWWEYGSPERDQRELQADRVRLEEDGRTLILRIPDMRSGRVLRARLAGLQAVDGTPLWHEEFAYTINQIPGRLISRERVVKTVEPPPARASGEEGWLRLTYGDALDAWVAEGWELCEAALDSADPRKFKITPGNSALCNTSGDPPSEFVSRLEFGDIELQMAFMLPEAGNSGLYIMGRYEVQLLDSVGVLDPGPGDCGGIYAGNTWPGAAPLQNAYGRPGQWHELELTFRAPRFDEAGNKVASARFEEVRIDGVLIHEDIEVPEPTRGGWPGEVARGPLRIQGDHGPVAIGNVRVKPLTEELPAEGVWQSLLEADDLGSWQVMGADSWTLEDEELVASGPASLLVSRRSDLHDLEVRTRLKLSDGGRAALLLCADGAASDSAGYELILNSSFADQRKTGSVAEFSAILTHLIAPDTWYNLRATCRTEPGGKRLKVWLNGILVNEVLDPEGNHRGGHLALSQHHTGSVLEVSKLKVRSLP
jgi:glucose/arabinose dehydrogenase